MKTFTVNKGNYIITTDKSKLDVVAIHDFLSNSSYWAKNIPIEKVKDSIDNSLNFGIFENGKQIGYAKVVSDFATVAYLGDVYVLPEFRGRGLSKWLMEEVMSHPNLQGLRRWILLTSDAHLLYKQFGWTEISSPDKWMELHNKNVYQ
jgi:GNAT superfamily N-acetyltransferase